ncbi:hypothetical protein [Streptomyces sp. NPDC003032]
MDGVWDDADGLEVTYVGVDLSEETIRGVVEGNSSNNAFTETVEAENEAEAFRALAESLDASSVWDCRGAKPQRVYTQPEDGDDA